MDALSRSGPVLEIEGWERFPEGELRCWIGTAFKGSKTFIILRAEENGWHTPYGEPGIIWSVLVSGNIEWMSAEYIDEWSVPVSDCLLSLSPD